MKGKEKTTTDKVSRGVSTNLCEGALTLDR